MKRRQKDYGKTDGQTVKHTDLLSLLYRHQNCRALCALPSKLSYVKKETRKKQSKDLKLFPFLPISTPFLTFTTLSSPLGNERKHGCMDGLKDRQTNGTCFFIMFTKDQRGGHAELQSATRPSLKSPSLIATKTLVFITPKKNMYDCVDSRTNQQMDRDRENVNL